MKSLAADGSRDQVLWSLHALGGEATLGDLLTLTGLPRIDLDRSLDSLIARGQAQVRVLEYGDLTYHVSESESGWPSGLRRSPLGLSRHSRAAALARARRILFDRRTLRLLRAREGVLSLAELVEQTGLPLREAEEEMVRMAESWGGEAHTGLDGHVVYAFPEIMSSVHGRFAEREPRPAWVHSDDPMDHTRERLRSARVGLGAIAAGCVTAGVGPWVLGPALGITTILGAAALSVAAGGILVGFGARLVLRNHRRFRFSQQDALRRYAFGCVVQTALAGKGVVSLERVTGLIQRRAGKVKVRKSKVEAALRELATEFDAPITSQGGDLFFGFRNVKRQFLASHLLRRTLRLGSTVSGSTVFDSGDSREVAWRRELDAFDRAPTSSGSETGPDGRSIRSRSR